MLACVVGALGLFVPVLKDCLFLLHNPLLLLLHAPSLLLLELFEVLEFALQVEEVGCLGEDDFLISNGLSSHSFGYLVAAAPVYEVFVREVRQMRDIVLG